MFVLCCVSLRRNFRTLGLNTAFQPVLHSLSTVLSGVGGKHGHILHALQHGESTECTLLF